MRSSRSLCVVTVLAAGVLLGASAAANATGCTAELLESRARAWMQSSGWVPHTPEEVAGVPAELRSVVVSLLPSDVRSELWTGAFRSYLASHQELTGEQAQVVRDAIALATPAFFSLGEGDIGWHDIVQQPILALTRKGQTLFSPSEFRRLFLDMNGALESAEATTSGSPAVAYPNCNCNKGNNNLDCIGTAGAVCTASPCVVVANNCGVMGSLDCNGRCLINIVVDTSN